MQSNNGFLGKLRLSCTRALVGNSGEQASMDSELSGVPVTVNVYDMHKLNSYTSSLGIGVYHTGVVVHGIEYCYGGHPLHHSGIFAMAPQDTELIGSGYSYRTSLLMGRTDFTESEVHLILEEMGPRFQGNQYHLLRRNCNHFTEEFIQTLCGASLPKWINRLASMGARFALIERSIPKCWLTPRPLQDSDEDSPELPVNGHQTTNDLHVGYHGRRQSSTAVEYRPVNSNGAADFGSSGRSSSVCASIFVQRDLQKSTKSSCPSPRGCSEWLLTSPSSTSSTGVIPTFSDPLTSFLMPHVGSGHPSEPTNHDKNR